MHNIPLVSGCDYYHLTAFNSFSDPGACFVCNTCPSDRPSSSESEAAADECDGRPSGEGSAACVETTAYALLALLEAEDTTSTVCLAQWLVRIRSGTGGFYSSQVQLIHSVLVSSLHFQCMLCTSPKVARSQTIFFLKTDLFF